MEKPHTLLIIFHLSFAPIAFSQSGAAKSLEIGNIWIWENAYIIRVSSPYDTTITYIYEKVINDTIINNNKYAELELGSMYLMNRNGKYQRVDSNKLYFTYNGHHEELRLDYDWKVGDNHPKQGWRISAVGQEELWGIKKKYLEFNYWDCHEKHMENFGLVYYFFGWDFGHVGKLIGAKLDGIVYGEIPSFSAIPKRQYTNKNEVKYKLNNNTSSLVNNVQYNINNSELIDVSPNTEVLSILTEEEGNYNIEFNILNVFDESYSDFATFIVDRTPPTIHLEYELDSKVYLNNVSQYSSIEYEIVDENFDKISYKLNEADSVFVDQQSSSIPLTNLKNNNVLEITAYDLAGNSTTKAYEIIVDSTIPRIDFNYPLESINLLVNDGNQLSLDYKVVEKYFDKIGYSINNSEWVWSEEKKSTFNITVENDDDHIQIKAIDLAGNESEIYEINVEKIADFKLTQNFPNPFNPTTQISYELPQDSVVELVIYNSLGEEVSILVNNSQSLGRYTINWYGLNSDGEQVPGGIYFYQLKTKDFTQTKKMLLLR